MIFKTCLHCGANLDPGELCDCQRKKKEAAPLDPERPQTKEHSVILSVPAPAVKDFNLRSLRQESGASAKEMVLTVKRLYPKYDKTLQSKCERGEEYGITLRPDAIVALNDVFGRQMKDDEPPAGNGPQTPRKSYEHRLKCRITCRLSNEDYGALQQRLRADGITTQEWISQKVRQYLATEQI